MSRLTPDRWLVTLLVLGPLALYLKTASPTVYSLDAAELTIAAYTWGIPHATGYPLFLLLGRLFITLLPVGDIAYRMTVMTALFAALVPGVLYLILRQLRVHAVPAALACASFAVSYFQWASAVVTKEHSLRDLLLALVLLSLVKWRRTGTWGWLAAAAGLAGLSLSNHLSAALYAPPLAIWVLLHRRLSLLQGAAAAGAAVVGLLPYVYLPLAYLARPAFNMAGQFDVEGQFHAVNLASVDGLVWMLSGRQFGALMLAAPLADLPGRVAQLAFWLWGSFFGVGVVLGVFGWAAFVRRDRWFASLAAVLMVAHAAFFLTYAAPDVEAMFVPVYLLWTIPLAFGISSSAAILRRAARARLAFAVAAAGILAGGAVNYPLLDLSSDRRVSRWAHEFMDNLPPRSVVLARWISSGPLQYLQLVEGSRPDVTVIDRFLMPAPVMGQFVLRHLDERPIVLDAGDLLGLEGWSDSIAAQQLPGQQAAILSRQGEPAFPGMLLRRNGAEPRVAS